MDELANLAQIDPLEYRLRFMKDKPRHVTILNQLASQSIGEANKLPKGHGKGIAINDGSPLRKIKRLLHRLLRLQSIKEENSKLSKSIA